MHISSDSDDFHSCSDSDSFVNVPSLGDTLESNFSDVPKNFNVVHINAQSVPAHFTDMLANFDCKNIHAILVSESWLKPSLASTSYSLPGFVLLRNDRKEGRGGGVAIYLRAHIPHKIIHFSSQPPPPNAGEHLFLEVELHHTKILLGVYYCPSLHVNYFSSFECLLHTLTPSYSQTIIMGDFNTCLIKNDSRSSSLLSISNSINLSILPLNATHHPPNFAPSLLDLIFVSSLEHAVLHGQCPADSFSCHDLIFLSYKIRPPKAKSRILMQRNFSGMDNSKLCEDARAINWIPIYTAISIDDQLELFSSNLNQIYDTHAPIRPTRVRHLPAP